MLSDQKSIDTGCFLKIFNFSFFWWYRNRYRKNLVPEKSLGTGIGKIWYRKKVSEPVSEKFGTGADFCCQNFGIQKISNGYRNRYREFFIFSGGIGTIWYRKKVSEPASEKFGTRKSLGTETFIFVAKILEFRRFIIGTGTV